MTARRVWQGRRVLVASNAQEAISLFEANNNDIAALILDVTTAAAAEQLLASVKTERPDLRILLTSGYSESQARRLCPDFPKVKFIQKPYSAERIGVAVQELFH